MVFFSTAMYGEQRMFFFFLFCLTGCEYSGVHRNNPSSGSNVKLHTNK